VAAFDGGLFMTHPTIGYVMFAELAGLVFWLNIAGRKEFARRRRLAPEEQDRLKDSDWKWSQHYGL
jgi:hypothetical protein